MWRDLLAQPSEACVHTHFNTRIHLICPVAELQPESETAAGKGTWPARIDRCVSTLTRRIGRSCLTDAAVIE